MPKVYAVVRTTTEKSILDCIKSLVERGIPFSVVRYEPLELATKEIIRTGWFLKDKYDWIMALDADICLTMSKKEIEEYCGEQEKEYPGTWCFVGRLDCTKRGLISGLHFYQTKHCEKAYNAIRDKDFQYRKGREEYEICNYLGKEHGLDWKTTGYKKISFGIHYFDVNKK